MSIFEKTKDAVQTVEDGYNKAEGEVDSFFSRNRYTVVILSGVAVGIVVLAVLALIGAF